MRATPAEHRFKEACRALIRRGIHPTPGSICRELGRSAYAVKRGNLSGPEVRWLREDLKVSPTRKSPYMAKMGPCKLFCCGGSDFPYDEIAVVCSNKHLELVRIIRAGGRILMGSGADQCTYCDEWRDQGEIARLLDGALRRSRPLSPPPAKPGTIDKGLPMLSNLQVAMIVLLIGALVAGLSLLGYFIGG